jgi:FkbM family methyltransferase
MIKGLAGRLAPARNESRYPAIPWLKEKIIKHRDDTTEKRISLHDFSLYYQRPREVLHTYDEIFHKEMYRFDTGNPHPVILDCGANIGLSVIYFKKLFPGAELIAFEPDEANYALLMKNIELNGLQNVTVHKAAVWVKDGTITFEAGASEGSSIADGAAAPAPGSAAGAGSAATLHDSAGATHPLIEVASMRLANLLAAREKIDFLKMDIEGAEWNVLMDSADHLDKIDHMFIEYHGLTFETEKLAELLELFDRKHFQVYIRNAADGLTHPYIQQRTGEKYDVQLNMFCYKKNQA